MRMKFAGVLIGLLVAMLTIVTGESIANRLYLSGLGEDASATVPTVQQPPALLATTCVGWFLAGLLGAAAALAISRVKIAGWIVAAGILIGVAARLMAERQPDWMFVAGPLAPILGATVAQLLLTRRVARSRAVSDTPDSPH